MITSFITTKKTMTQAWDKAGKRRAITILTAHPMVVTQVKSIATDGYTAIQVGVGEKRRVSQPLAGHLKKANQKRPPRHVQEITINEPANIKVGDTITADQVLSVGDTVAVQAKTKGRGFAGVVKRWGFAGGPKTHGQSDRHRAPGSIGQGTDPGRIHKGKKMAGRYGNQTQTIKNLAIFKVDKPANEIWITGPVPGAKGSIATLTKITKTTNLQNPGTVAESQTASREAQLPMNDEKKENIQEVANKKDGQ